LKQLVVYYSNFLLGWFFQQQHSSDGLVDVATRLCEKAQIFG